MIACDTWIACDSLTACDIYSDRAILMGDMPKM